MILDYGRQVTSWHTVEGLEGGAVPETAKFGDALGELVEATEEFYGMKAGSGGEFGGDVFVVNAVAGVQVQEAEGIAVGAEAADEGIDGIKFGVAEEAHPQFKVGAVAARGIHVRTGAFPQAAAPESGFLLDVAVGSGQEARTRPARQIVNAESHTFFVEPGGAAGDPFHFGEIAEDGADDGKAAGVELVGGGDPAHDFAGGAGESFIEGVVHALIGFGEPAGDLRFVFANDVEGAVGGSAIDDEVFEIGIILGEDRLDGLLDVFRGVENGSYEG